MISPVSCAVPNRPAGAPKLSGAGTIRIRPGSRLHTIYGAEKAEEEYFCNYEVNPGFESRLERAGLEVVARGPQGESRAVELKGRRFFLATLFQPQLSSQPRKPHAVFVEYLRAAMMFQESREKRTAAKASD